MSNNVRSHLKKTHSKRRNVGQQERSTVNTFKIEKAKGTIPPEMYGQTAVLQDGVMYVFGGLDQNNIFHNKLFTYNIENAEWCQPETSCESPKARHFHTSVIYNDCMYIFGGKNNGYMNDLYSLDLKSLTWTKLDNYSGKPPSNRYGHSSVVFNKCMYVYGGYDDYGYKCNDIHEYRFESNEWRKIETHGREVPEKFHHTAVVRQGSMYVFGGVEDKPSNALFEYRFATKTWAKVYTVGKPPDRRWGHSAVVFKHKIFIWGGCDNVINFKDVWTLNLETCNWGKAQSEAILPRYFHSVVVHNEKMYIFAGKNIHNYCFNEMYSYSFDVYSETRPDTFLTDMKQLINNKEFSDVYFLFPEENDTRIYAHKNVLTARCASFKAMLRSNMKESKEGKIVISDVSSIIFVALLEYLYTSELNVKIKNSSESLIELLKLSDQYILGHLKALCERQLKSHLNVNNVSKFFEVAQKYEAPELYNCCVKFAVKCYDVLQKRNDVIADLKKEAKLLLNLS